MKLKQLSMFVLGLFLVGMVSANGISVISSNTFTINKTYNHDTYVNLTIRNDEPFDFFNVSMEDNPYITISKIPKLATGETRNITALVKANDNIHKDIKIFGFYLASLGAQNQTHQVDITYDDGLSKCDFTIVQGDKVNWKNLEIVESKTVKLKNMDTLNYFQDLAAQASNLQFFDSPMSLPFQFIDRTGYSRQSCVLTVLSDTGYVNNPEHDASINIDINVEFPQTSVELLTLNDKYSMRFYDTREDIFSVRNTGNEIAKNVNLEGDWFVFSTNNFDLEPGQSKNVGYTIDPKIYDSNETNKNYTKTLSITGNFESITRDFNVYIEYAEFVDDENASRESKLEQFCSLFPEMCEEPAPIIKYIDDGEREFNVSYTDNQVKALYDLFYDNLDAQAIKDKQLTEFTDAIDGKLLSIQNATLNSNSDIGNIKTQIDTSNGTILFSSIIIGLIACCIVIFILLLKYRDKFRSNIWSRYG